MTPNPILKVLSTFKKYKVKALLIGGQACIIYGAAEFSRDSDFAIVSTPQNIKSLNKSNPSDKLIRWWFHESRVPETLTELTVMYPRLANESVAKRPLLTYAISKDPQKLNSELHKEEQSERQKDIEYWAPLKKELENMRYKR